MNGNVDLASRQGPFDFAGEKTFATRAGIDRLRLSIVAARRNDLRRDLELRPRSPERCLDHGGLGAGQLAAARAENDFFRTTRAHAAPYDSRAKARGLSEGA